MIFLDYDQVSKKGFLKIQGEVSGECPDFPAEMTDLTVEVDSWGGDFFLGLELYRELKKLTCRKTAKVATAMSAATMPVCACSSIILQPDSLFMIHGVTAVGIDCNQQEALRLAGELGAMNRQLAGIYASACKKSESEILSLIEKETYLSPAEMRDLGFPVIIENLKNKKNSKKKSYDSEGFRTACQTFVNSLIRRIAMEEEKKEEEKKEEEKVEQECKTEEVTPEVEETPETPALTEDRVREICVEVFNQLFANLKNEEEKESDADEGNENGTGAEIPSEEKKEEDTEAKVAAAVKAERTRIAALNSYSGIADQSFLSTAIESGLSESEFAVEVLRQQKLANEKRRQSIASTAPLAPVQNFSEPVKSEPKADPKRIMNLIFG